MVLICGPAIDIKKELKLDVSRFTILRTLGRHGYHWRQVPHKGFIKPEHIQKRKEWVDKHLHHRPAWWVENMHLVFDGSPIHQSHVDEERGSHGPRCAHVQQVLSIAAEINPV